MTMHLVGPYMTTTSYNNSKKKSKKTQSQIQAEQAHEKYLRKMGVHPDQLEAKKIKSVKCYGSTSVSKTESRGSTPCTDANTKWQNGYATDCNSVYAGSIPALVSKILRPLVQLVRTHRS